MGQIKCYVKVYVVCVACFELFFGENINFMIQTSKANELWSTVNCIVLGSTSKVM